MKYSKPEFLELSRDILKKGASLRFQAKGWSMFPAVRDGDILEIEPVDARKIRRGDVIFHRTEDGRTVIHRVIRKFSEDNRPAFITKGDSSPGCGESVVLKEVLGRVAAVERNGQRIIFNSGLNRLMNIFYANISPFSRWTYPLARRIKHIFNSK